MVNAVIWLDNLPEMWEENPHKTAGWYGGGPLPPILPKVQAWKSYQCQKIQSTDNKRRNKREPDAVEHTSIYAQSQCLDFRIKFTGSAYFLSFSSAIIDSTYQHSEMYFWISPSDFPTKKSETLLRRYSLWVFGETMASRLMANPVQWSQLSQVWNSSAPVQLPWACAHLSSAIPQAACASAFYAPALPARPLQINQ